MHVLYRKHCAFCQKNAFSVPATSWPQVFPCQNVSSYFMTSLFLFLPFADLSLTARREWVVQDNFLLFSALPLFERLAARFFRVTHNPRAHSHRRKVPCLFCRIMHFGAQVRFHIIPVSRIPRNPLPSPCPVPCPSEVQGLSKISTGLSVRKSARTPSRMRQAFRSPRGRVDRWRWRV